MYVENYAIYSLSNPIPGSSNGSTLVGDQIRATTQVLDFAHWIPADFTPPKTTLSMKSWRLQFARELPESQGGFIINTCFEINTSQFRNPSVDTRIYGRTGWNEQGDIVSLDDDGGGAYFSKVRIWVGDDYALYALGKQSYQIIVTGYDANINNAAFKITTRYIGRDYNQCNNGSPLVILGDGISFINKN